MSSLILTSKCSNTLQRAVSTGADSTSESASNSFKYHRLTSPEFSSTTDRCASAATSSIQKIMTFTKQTDELPDDIADPIFYEYVKDVIDVLLDSASVRMSAAKSELASSTVALIKQSMLLDKSIIINSHIKEIPKPQLTFLGEIDNSRMSSFRPRVRAKYHQTTPLELKELPFLADEDGESSDQGGGGGL